MFQSCSAIIRLTKDGVNYGTFVRYTDAIPWFTLVCLFKNYLLLIKNDILQ